MIKPPKTIEELLDYWPGNIPFKGSLISDDNSCMCAQGQALHFLGGLTPEELHEIDQRSADKRVAELFGISVAHSVLLRIVNDQQEGAPTCVIRNPEQVLGPNAQAVLAFWRHLDQMTPAAGEAAREAAGEAAFEAVGEAARAAAWAAAWAAVEATHEIQGADVMRAKGEPFVFLPLFGFENPESILNTPN